MSLQPRIVDIVSPKQAELFFGIVAPTGIDLGAFQTKAANLLAQYGYSTTVIRLSDLAKRASGTAIDESSHYSRIMTLQTKGNELRTQTQRGDVLALHAISEISDKRTVIEVEGGSHRQPQYKTAHLLRSLKHPREVETLRRVYGAGFFLIGVHAPASARFKYLSKELGMTKEQAREVLARDQEEEDKYGQHTRDTFHLSDVFVRDGDLDQLERFFNLLFGSPFITPTLDEYSMFLAFASALRSAQFGRQVGAVVVKDGEIIGVGANDVPKFGGGLYWPGPEGEDRRDHNYRGGLDSNEAEIKRIIDDAISRVKPHLKEGVDAETLTKALAASRLNELTEFGRAVHAEMEALLACARSGVSVRGATLYTTTFPCHNCARHIVAAGVTEVVYVEPYSKSRAPDLHDDSIAIDQPTGTGKVRFRPFVGVAARRYFDLFSMKLGSGVPTIRKKGDKAVTWEKSSALPKSRVSPLSYIQREREVVRLLVGTIPREPDELKDSGPAEPTEEVTLNSK